MAVLPGFPRTATREELRKGLLQKLESFSGQLRGKAGQSSDVPARSRKAGDKPASNRIAIEGHDDRKRVRRCLDGPGDGWAGGDDEVYIETQELGRERGDAI